MSNGDQTLVRGTQFTSIVQFAKAKGKFQQGFKQPKTQKTKFEN